MVRNFSIVNGFPCSPGRCCRKSSEERMPILRARASTAMKGIKNKQGRKRYC